MIIQKKLISRNKKKVKNIQNMLIVGIGEIVWDIFPDGPQLGGAPANFIYYSHLLGVKSILVSRIGKDSLGDATLNKFKRYNLSTRYIQVDNIHPTGTVNVKLNSNGKPKFIIRENAAWDFLEKNISLSHLAKKASVVYFGTLAFRSPISRSTIEWFLNQIEPNCIRVLDINLRPPYFSKELINLLLQIADVLKLNEEELEILSSSFSWDIKDKIEILRFLLNTYSIKLIALTKGEKGSYLITKENFYSHPGFPVKTVDTVGAGDAFTAGLAIGLLKGEELEKINLKANWLASRVCTKRGAWVEIDKFTLEINDEMIGK